MNDVVAPFAVTQPLGLIRGLDINEYHSGPGISKTGLTDLERSPAIYYAKHLDPQRPVEETKAGQLEGQLTHCAILEPEEFGKRYIVGPDCRRGTKEWKAFEDDHPGLTIIKPDQYEVAMRQSDSVRKLPEAKALLDHGEAEVSAYWIDPDSGVLCRCRPDWVAPINEGGVILADVKTCSDASPQEFARQIARKTYHIQAAYYTDGYGAAARVLVHAFVFFAVEDQYPYASCAIALDPEGEALGRATYRALLQTYARCQETRSWPGYSDAIELVSLPSYMTRGFSV